MKKIVVPSPAQYPIKKIEKGFDSITLGLAKGWK